MLVQLLTLFSQPQKGLLIFAMLARICAGKNKSTQNTVHGIGIYHQNVSLWIPLQEFHFKAVLYLQQFPSPKVSNLLLTPKKLFPGPQWSKFCILSFCSWPHQVPLTSAAGSSPTPARQIPLPGEGKPSTLISPPASHILKGRRKQKCANHYSTSV